MVNKRTEYRTSFQRSNARELRHRWKDNVDYCLNRRHSEQVHTPLEWDGELSVCETESTPRGIPSHIYKHEKYNDAYDERQRLLMEERLASLQLGKGAIDIGPGLTVGHTESLSPEVGTPTSVRDAHHGHGHCSACQGKAQADSEQVQTGVGEGKAVEEYDDVNNNAGRTPRKAIYRKPVPKPRPMSAPLGRPVKKHVPESCSSPFVSYGARDKERETGRKRTHNVRASSGIYPSALRAYRRRELDVRRRQESAKAAPYREKRRRALFNDKPPEVWDTEYRAKYAGYEPRLYRHNLLKRHDPRLIWQTYDVP